MQRLLISSNSSLFSGELVQVNLNKYYLLNPLIIYLRMRLFTKAVARRCSAKSYSRKFCKIPTKITVLESLFKLQVVCVFRNEISNTSVFL